MKQASVPIQYYQIESGSAVPVDPEIITEAQVSLTVNGEVWLTFMCTPLVGPLAAQWLGTRHGRVLPLSIGCALVGGGGFLATHAPTPFAMVAGIAISSAALMFGAPYFLGFAADLDPPGRIAAAARGFHVAGSALAPALAGGILGLTGAYTSIGWMSLVAAAASFALVMIVATTTSSRSST